MKPPILVFVALGLASVTQGFAATELHHSLPNAPRSVTVSESAAPPVIRAALLQSTLILLPLEEKVATVFGGDTVDWVFDGGHVASRFISVKPKVANATTDIHIVSDHGNEYTLELQEISTDADQHFDSKVLLVPGDKAAKDRLAELPVFVPAADLEKAKQDAAAAKAAATAELKAEGLKSEQYHSQYPGSLHFDYSWDQKKGRELGLEQVWRDDKFTYLNLAEAPFDREDTTLSPAAGACVTCPRRSGFNTSLFADVQGDQCLDAPCYQAKVVAHIDRELTARPELVAIETGWRAPKEQRPGALTRHQYRELPDPDNPDAEPPCPSARPAIIVFGKHVGRTVTVCLDDDCPVHTHHQTREAIEPPPSMPPAPEQETEEEAAQRIAEHEQRMAEYRAEQQRKEEERKAEYERQQKEYEAEQARREELRKKRRATFERILDNAPASFDAAQMRFFLRLVIQLDYSFLEEVATRFANDNEKEQQSDDEIVLAALNATTDEKLTSLALRLVLSDYLGIPHENQPDLLSEAEAVFVLMQTKTTKTHAKARSKQKSATANASPKNGHTKKKAV